MSVRDRWQSANRYTRVVVAVTVAVIVFRLAIASQSTFGFHQGWNEGHYALIAEGFLRHPLVPRYGTTFVYSVPPLFPYLVAVSFVVFGESPLAARIPSILAFGALLPATYWLGLVVFEDRRVAASGTLVLAVLPYAQLYGGRAQTDMLLTALFTASLAAIVAGYTRDDGSKWPLGLGGFLFAAGVAAKQPALAIPGIVLAWLLGNRRVSTDTVRQTGILIAASALALLPLVAWLMLNYQLAPTAFLADWKHELFSRTAPFANVPLVVLIGLGLGVTPPVLGAAAIGVAADLRATVRSVARRWSLGDGPSVLTWWLLLYGMFVLVRTPHGHQYYVVTLLPPLALLAAHGVEIAADAFSSIRSVPAAQVRTILLVVLLLSGAAGTLVLFELSGEFSIAEGSGSTVTASTAAYLQRHAPSDATILVSNGYAPPMKWALRDTFPPQTVRSYYVGTLTSATLRAVQQNSSGPVYVVSPTPLWARQPRILGRPIFESDTYEYTIMALGSRFIETSSKFGMYLEDRGLRVYKLQANASNTSRMTQLPTSIITPPRTAR